MASVKKITMREYNGTDYDTLYPKTIASQVDGIYSKEDVLSNDTKALYGLADSAVPDDVLRHIGAELRITATAGSIATARIGDIAISAVADSSGHAKIYIPRFGDWSVESIAYGISTVQNITVDTAKVYNLGASVSLEDATWGFISSASENGVANQIWAVGDTKTINVGSEKYEIQIIDFNHDELTNGGTAGITFQLKECLNKSYVMDSNYMATAARSWETCNLRTSTIPSVLNSLEEELSAVIKSVNKKSVKSTGPNAGIGVVTTSDKLFIPSYIELKGSDATSGYNEGSQYAFYAAGNSKVKKANGSAVKWWTRSHYPSNTGSTYYGVYDNGNDVTGVSSQDSSIYVSFCFCV